MNERIIRLEHTFALEEQYEAMHFELLRRKFFPKQIIWVSKFINAMHGINPKTAYRLTMMLLSVSIKRRLRAEDSAFYAKGQREVLYLGKRPFYLYAYGSGPEVYLIHGWASAGYRWKPYVQVLVERGYRAIVVDAPGHGTSPGRLLSIPDYISVLQMVFQQSRNLHGVISHSIGAMCSVIALSQGQVERPFRIALLSTFNACRTLLEKFSMCIGIRDHVIRGVTEWIPEYAGQELSYFSVTRHLANLTCQSMLVYDRDDRIVPSSEVINILNTYPDIRYHPTFGLGHNLKNQQVTGKVLDFIT